MEIVVYCRRPGLAICPGEAREILGKASAGAVFSATLEAGLRTVEAEVRGDRILTRDGVEIPLDCLASIAEGGDDTLFLVDEGAVSQLKLYADGKYYRLCCTASGVPTLEISGIHMHNIAGTSPWSDAVRKVKLADVRRGLAVLDICTGLGYTAINSALRGGYVVSIEKDVNVIRMAEYNPWSRGLATPLIELIRGDAVEVVQDLPDEAFHRIIHDPPRFALAGELYSEAFYRELYRVLRSGGVMFHYTGGPRKHAGVKFQAGVVRRLRSSGFHILRVLKNYGVVAAKR